METSHLICSANDWFLYEMQHWVEMDSLVPDQYSLSNHPWNVLMDWTEKLFYHSWPMVPFYTPQKTPEHQRFLQRVFARNGSVFEICSLWCMLKGWSKFIWNQTNENHNFEITRGAAIVRVILGKDSGKISPFSSPQPALAYLINVITNTKLTKS